MTFDNPLGYIWSKSMHMQNFIEIFQTVKELSTFFTTRPGTKSSQTVLGQNLHKLSGDKIKCLIIGHSMKFNFKFQLTFLRSCNFKLLPSFSGCAGRFESTLVANPEGRFLVTWLIYTYLRIQHLIRISRTISAHIEIISTAVYVLIMTDVIEVSVKFNLLFLNLRIRGVVTIHDVINVINVKIMSYVNKDLQSNN